MLQHYNYGSSTEPVVTTTSWSPMRFTFIKVSPQGGFVTLRMRTALSGKKVPNSCPLIEPFVIIFVPPRFDLNLLKDENAVPASSLEIEITASSANGISLPTAGVVVFKVNL